jgi:hypothetical protein
MTAIIILFVIIGAVIACMILFHVAIFIKEYNKATHRDKQMNYIRDNAEYLKSKFIKN